MSSAQQKRESLLSMIRGGSGETEDYIEVIHYTTPEGAPNGVGYREHYFCKEYKTGKPYELIIESRRLEEIEGIREVAHRGSGVEYSPLPVKDLGTTKVGAPKDGEIRYIGL